MKLALRLGAPLIALSTGLLALSAAQDGPRAQSNGSASSKSSESVRAVSSSSNGQERTYRRVVRDGKVVEESGDPSLGRGLGTGAGKVDLEDLMRRARQGAPGANSGANSDSSSSSSSSSSSRRIVIRNGEVIEDSATENGKPVRPGAGRPAGRPAGRVGGPARGPVDIDRELERMMEEMSRKAGVDLRGGLRPGGNASTSSSSSSRRIVVRDGKVVEDSATSNGKPVDPRSLPELDDLLKRARGASGRGLGEGGLDDILRDLEGRRSPRQGNPAPAGRGGSKPGAGSTDRRTEVDRILRELRGGSRSDRPTERRLGRTSRGDASQV